MKLHLSTSVLLVSGAALFAPSLAAQDVDYRKAELLLNWHTSPLIAGDQVRPNWIEDEDRFWYRNKTGEGHEFVFVDAPANQKRPLFDHDRLAAAMSLANDTSYVAKKLPFEEFEFVDGDLARIEFEASKKRFDCNLAAYTCAVGDTVPDPRPFVESPDGQWEAFVMDHNLYMRPTAGGDTVQLTTDGEEFNGYGLNYPRPNQVKDETPRRPTVHWSPDSKKLLVQRQDQRDVEHHHYISYTPQRPV
ncbi:MAG: DPP IV N-terminal domain-containing protein, partial [Longimicrobiales bacterium]